MRGIAVLAGLSLLASAAHATETPGVVVLEVVSAPLPGQIAEAAPVRFALQENGSVYVGGSHVLQVGVLSEREIKDLEKQVASVRKNSSLGGAVTLGPGTQRYRLVLRKGRPLEMRITGDPTQASSALRPLAALVQELADFSHPSLKPFAPQSYAVAAREQRLAGGCRLWTGRESVARHVFTPGVEDASAFPDWPSGVAPASVCGGKTGYSVTLRPLIPGERP